MFFSLELEVAFLIILTTRGMLDLVTLLFHTLEILPKSEIFYNQQRWKLIAYISSYVYCYCDSVAQDESGKCDFETKKWCPKSLELQSLAQQIKDEVI